SIPWINVQLAAIGDGAPAPIDPESQGFPRGYAVHQLLKTAEYSRLGARYLVALDPLAAVAARRFADTKGASERLMGEAQREWFLETIQRSTRTFKVWGSPIAFMPKVVDVRNVLLLPPELRGRYLLTADDWDGFPNERRALLDELAEVGNVVIVSGDLHCFLVGTPFDEAAPSRRVVEFCTGAVSSTTWLEGIERLAAADASIPEAFSLLAPAVGALLTDRETRANPHLAFHELGKNGYAVLSVSGEALETQLFLIDPQTVATPPDALVADLGSYFKRVRFRVPVDSASLERLDGSGVARWDTDEMDWVVA
ncbi:MAG TPA: alkaline phosphatase D family protein, partial [Polyangiaceae bacterium]|nr:alkaline phosphatase D family protein [Polyangiaceae bacterium]